MRAELLSRLRRADEKALRADGCGTRAIEEPRDVLTRESGCERRGDREKDLRSRARKLREARQDFPAAIPIDPRTGTRAALGRVHPARHTGKGRRTDRR